MQQRRRSRRLRVDGLADARDARASHKEWTAKAVALAEEPDSPMAPDVAPSSPPASPRCPSSSKPWLQARREQNVARNQPFSNAVI